MTENNNSNMKSIIVTSIVFFCLMLLGSADNILLLLLLFGSIPIAYIYMLKGHKISFIYLIISILVLYFSSGSFKVSIIISLTIFVAGLLLGYCLKEKKDLIETLILTSAGYIIPLLLSIFTYNYIEDENQIQKYILQPMHSFIASLERDIITVLNETNGKYPFTVSEIESQMELLEYSLKILVPGIIIVIIAYVSIISIYSVVNLIRKKGFSLDNIPRFSMLKAPKIMVIILIITWIIMLTSQKDIFNAAMANMNFIIYSIILLYGISLLEFYIITRTTLNLPFRLLIYIGGFFVFIPIQFVLPFINPIRILIFIAIIDSLLDFRKISQPEE